MMTLASVWLLRGAVLVFALGVRLILWKRPGLLMPFFAAVALVLGDGLVIAWLTMVPGADLHRVTVWLFAVAGVALVGQGALEPSYYWVRGFRWGKSDYDAMARAMLVVLQKAGRTPADLRFYPNGVVAIRGADGRLLADLEDALRALDRPDDRWLGQLLALGFVFLCLLALITGLAYYISI